jgi:hypothetical protein
MRRRADDFVFATGVFEKSAGAHHREPGRENQQMIRTIVTADYICW